MASAKFSRFSPLVRGPASVLRRLQALSWLTPVLALGGAALWFFLTVRAVLDLGADRHVAAHVEFAKDARSAGELYYQFFRTHWLLAGKCLLPALLFALILRRGKALVLPVTLLCGWLYLLWLGYDLHTNLARALRDPLGMTAAPETYYIKLALMGFLSMSVPLLLLLYSRAPLMDKYVVRTLAVPFLLCTGGIAGIMITMDLLNHANDFVDAKFSLGKVGEFYLAQMPQILVTITEAALLLSTLYALGRMSRYNELISMLTSGRSLLRVLLPVFIFGGWCSLGVLALNYQLAPQAERTKEEMLKDTSAKKGVSSQMGVEYNVSYRNRADQRFWLINRMPYDLAEGNPMRDVWVVQQDAKGDPQRLIVAQKAKWNAETRDWLFESATILHFGPGQTQTRQEYWEKYPVREWRETPGSILSDKLNPEYLGVPELVTYLRTNYNLPERSLAKYEATKHWRFAMPFRCFLLVLLAAPLGITTSRRGLLGGVAGAVGLFMGVFFLSTMMLKAGEGLYIPAVAGAWSVNGITLLAGLFLLWKRSTGRRLPWFRRSCQPLTVKHRQPASAGAASS